MVFLLTGGGSAGHVNPALAMAQMLRRRYPSAEFYFLGKEDGIELSLSRQAEIPFIPVKAKGLRRSLSPQNFSALFSALTEPHRLKRLLRELSADLVIGTGGHVSYPVIKAASLLGIPSVLHESNAVPGLTVKLCERLTEKTLLQFPCCAERLRHPERSLVIGAPLRDGFLCADRQKARQCLGISPSAFFILSFGGSLGAEGLNRACLRAMQHYEKTDRPILFIHACGNRYYEALRREFSFSSPQTVLLPYINDMPLYMAAADLVISRAGATTLSEIAALGKPSILIPSPFVAEDHQRKNALYLAEKGAALLLEEDALTGDSLTEAIEELRRSPSRLARMGKAASTAFSLDTEALFLAEVRGILGK